MKQDGTALSLGSCNLAAFYIQKGKNHMEKLTQLKDEGLAKIEQCGSASELQALRVLYLGKKGPIQELLSNMGVYL